MLPHASVALYILSLVSRQATVLCKIVLTCTTVTEPGQASETVTEPVFGSGIAALHPRANVPGQVIDGAVTSAVQFTVRDAVEVLPQAS